MRRGHLSVEFVLIVTLWSTFLAGLVSVIQWVRVQRYAQALARFGALAGSLEGMDPAVLESELHRQAASRVLPPGTALRWKTGRFLGTAAARFYDLFETQVTVESQRFGSGTHSLIIQKEGSS